MENGKIKKVTIVYENKTYMAKGEDAEDWLRRVDTLEGLAMSHRSMMEGCGFRWTQIKQK